MRISLKMCVTLQTIFQQLNKNLADSDYSRGFAVLRSKVVHFYHTSRSLGPEWCLPPVGGSLCVPRRLTGSFDGAPVRCSWLGRSGFGDGESEDSVGTGEGWILGTELFPMGGDKVGSGDGCRLAVRVGWEDSPLLGDIVGSSEGAAIEGFVVGEREGSILYRGG